jgi:hypothetical protein
LLSMMGDQPEPETYTYHTVPTDRPFRTPQLRIR